MHRFVFKPAQTLAVVLACIAIASTGSIGLGATNTREGCMDQWMFNGVWRVKVTKVDPLMDGSQQVGWQITESWRNGTSQEIAPGDSMLKDQVLGLEDGSSISAAASTTGTMSMGVVSAHDLAQAAQFTYVQIFRNAGASLAVKPKTLTILFDGDRLAQFKSRPQFTTPQYNYLIKLDCQATGTQGAQGGSFEIPATQGCMNQWMSNGLWRVRATAIAPNNGGGSAQIGWTVTQEWTSLAHQSIAAGDTMVGVQQLVLGNGDTLESDAGVISSGSFGQLAQHVFAPGGSFTYQQQFIQIPFNPVKPVKLIVTFDAAKEKLITYRPQYKVDPPNFRINLECTK